MNLENNIALSHNYVSVLEIENKNLFLTIVSTLTDDDDYSEKEPFVLIKDGKELKPSVHLIVITDMIGYDLNNKKIINLVIEKLKKICIIDESIEDELRKANNDLTKKVFTLINELNSKFTISQNWDLAKYLKAFDFSIDRNMISDYLDKTLQYLQIISDVAPDSVICFVNLKSLFNDENLLEIYKYAIYNNISILLLESVISNNKLKYEHKLIIDSEFDEFIIK